MNRKMYYFLLLCLGLGISFTSCLDDDNNNNSSIDDTWKYQQDTIFNNVAKNKAEYHEEVSQSKNGSVYWKESTEIIDSDILNRTTAGGKPEFTDTVVVRYEGWFLNANENNKKYIFDSTENPSMNSGGANPNKISRKFAVNKVIDGWTTILQDMTVGEERLVVIPQILGYGAAAQTNGTVVTIPGYTTLWFRMKLLKIIPMETKGK